MGLGYLHTSASYAGETETISGGGLGMDLAFGAAVARNLVIFGEIAVTSAESPTVKYGNASPTTTPASVDLVGFGPGLAYYLEPLNLYFSGSLQFSRVTASDNSGSSNDTADLTDMGFGASFMAGKEWWVSSNWGLGAATMLHFASMKLNGYDGRMTATGVSILFSATYN